MNPRRFIAIFFVFSFSIGASLAIVHAQSALSLPTDLQLSTSVDNPSPGQSVTITAASYSDTIDGAHFTWRIGSTVALDGIGKNQLTVTAPILGKKLNVSLTVVTTSGKPLSGSITVSSGRVDMIIETNGYAPVTFPGKLSPAYQNTVKIVAIPHVANSSGTEYDPKALVYTWKKDGSVLLDSSGYGKQAVFIQGDIIPRPFLVTVNVASRDGSAKAEGNANVSEQEPTIGFYVSDPLYGPFFNRAVGDYVTIGTQNETGILAVPFGFNDTSEGQSNLTYSWTINGTDHPELSGNKSVILHVPDASAGSSQISLSVANAVQILQGATASFMAYFKAGNAATSTTKVTF